MSEYDTEMAIACAYADMRVAERRDLAEQCRMANMCLSDAEFPRHQVPMSISNYNFAWAKLTGLPNHWEDGPYTADNMAEIPKAPSSCTGCGPYDDADALAQLEE